METYQLTSAAIGLMMAIIIVWLVRRDQLHGKFAPWWIAVAVVFAVFGVAPQLIDIIAGRLGVSYPPILMVLGGIAFLVLKVIIMDIERSRNVVQLQRLLQRVAMLEGELQAKGLIDPIIGQGKSGDTESIERNDD